MSTPNQPDRIIQLIRERFGPQLRSKRTSSVNSCCVGAAMLRLLQPIEWAFPVSGFVADGLVSLGLDQESARTHAKWIVHKNDYSCPDDSLMALREALTECDQEKLAAIT